MKLEQAARQALETLEDAYENGFLTGVTGLKTIDVLTALREALAEPNCQCGDKCFPIFSGDIEYCDTCGKPTALSEQATVSGGLCGGCAKKAADGWALYCVECWEKAEQEPVDHLGIKHDAQLVETFLRCPMTGNQLYFASEPIQKKGMNYMHLQDDEGNDWTLIARLDEGWDGK